MATPRKSQPPRKPFTLSNLTDPQAPARIDQTFADIYAHLSGPTYIEGGRGPARRRWRYAVDEETGELVTEREERPNVWTAGVFDPATGRWR